MNRRNYMREMDRIVEKSDGTKPRVLMHSCCGPCSGSVLEYMTRFFDITLLWYNPNIYPREEYELRLSTLRELLVKMGLEDKVSLLIGEYRSDEYYERVKGLENEPEGAGRCAVCFRLRLEECARIAKREGFDYFCSTLTLSRHKDAVLINALGEDAARKTGVSWLPSDFKKRNGENRSIELCEQYSIYRQLYCGCEFSLRHREAVAEITREDKHAEN